MDKTQRPKVRISDEVAEGTYTNSVVITHSQAEFVIDFMVQMPNMDIPQVKSRIVLTPEHVKRFAEALYANIKSYENEYGSIRIVEHIGSGKAQYPDTKGDA